MNPEIIVNNFELIIQIIMLILCSKLFIAIVRNQHDEGFYLFVSVIITLLIPLMIIPIIVLDGYNEKNLTENPAFIKLGGLIVILIIYLVIFS